MSWYEITKSGNGKERFRNLISGWQSRTYDHIYSGCGSYFKTKRGELYGFIAPDREPCEPIYLSIEVASLGVLGFCKVKSYRGYGIVNCAGVETLPSNCTSVTIHDENIVEFVRDGKQFLYFPQERVAYHEEYKSLELMKNCVKLYSDSNYQGLYTTSGVKLFNTEYLDIIPMSTDVYKAVDMNKQEILNSEFWEKPSAVCESIFPESNGFFRCKQPNGYNYISAKTGCNLTDNGFFEAGDFMRAGFAFVKIEPSERFQTVNSKGNVSKLYRNT